MAKILLITPQSPYPPHQGTSPRNLNILKALLIRNSVDLITFGNTADEKEINEHLPDCGKVITVPALERSLMDRLVGLATSRKPDMASRLESHEFDRKLAELLTVSAEDDLDPYDIVQVEGIELARVIPLVRRHSPPSKLVYDNHNAETELQRRAFTTDIVNPRRWPAALYSMIQVRRLARYEAWACQTADWVTAVSEKDKQILRKMAPNSRISVIPNCIDVISYSQKTSDRVQRYDVLFTGKMDYRPNVDAVLWFAEKIWPSVLKEHPDATWAVVGQKPHRRLDSIRNLPGVTITGWVEDILPFLSTAKVFVMPFRVGSGTRLKLIEAMAAGKAIVSTSIGAEGFDIQHGEQLLIADLPDAFAREVSHLLDNEIVARREIIPMFDEIYQELVRKN